MIQEKTAHKWVYFREAGEPEYVAVPEDTFYTAEDGRTYKRFYKGQEIPQGVYDEFFGKTKKAEKADEAEAPVEVEKPKAKK
jgi:hypothetical protein